MATRKGLEPSTSSVTGWHSNRLNYRATFYEIGGNNRARTCDPLLVRQMLSQLSYAPESSLDRADRGDEIYNTRSLFICQRFSSIFFKKHFVFVFFLVIFGKPEKETRNKETKPCGFPQGFGRYT